MLATQITTWALSVYAVVQGVGIVWGGDARWSHSSYAAAAALPGAPESWGAVLAVAGAAAVAGLSFRRPALTVTGLTLAGVWSLFFAVTFGLSMVEFHDASTTAPTVYLLVGALTLGAASVQWRGLVT